MKIIILIVIIIVLYLLFYNNLYVEKYENSSNSADKIESEAIQTIASMYNKNKLTTNNIQANDGNISNVFFTKKYTGSPDNSIDKAEIVNDSTVNKALIIAGNKSHGNGKKNVAILDNLTVKGQLYTEDVGGNDIVWLKNSVVGMSNAAKLQLGNNINLKSVEYTENPINWGCVTEDKMWTSVCPKGYYMIGIGYNCKFHTPICRKFS